MNEARSKKKEKPFAKKSELMKYANKRINRLLRLARHKLLKEMRAEVNRDEVKQGLWAEYTVDDALSDKFASGFTLENPT